MLVVFDSSYVLKLVDPLVKDEQSKDNRVEFLVNSLDRARTKIIIPTPALSEVLVGAGNAASEYLDVIVRSSRFKLVSFGTRAAVEAAAAHREAIGAGDKREGTEAPWAKVKFDRQIVAIAKVEGARIIYSNDADIVRYSARDGLEVINFDKLPFPPENLQGQLTLESSRDHDPKD